MVTDEGRPYMIQVDQIEAHRVSHLVTLYAVAHGEPPELRVVLEAMRADHLLGMAEHPCFPGGDLYLMTPAGWTALAALEQGWM